MTVAEKNLEVLKECYPEFYYKMTEEISLSAWKVRFLETKESEKAVVVESSEETVRLNSIYRPEKEAEKWLEQFEFTHRKINVIIFGLGNGLFVRRLLGKMQNDAKCFIYEPDAEILREVIKEKDMTDIFLHPQVTMIFGVLHMNFFDILHPYVNWSTIAHQISCIHPGYDKLYPQAEEEYWKTLMRLKASAELVKNTNAYFSRLSVENAIMNLQFIQKSNCMNELDSFFDESVSAIVVAAGPSLDKNIDVLAKAKAKAVIIATDTAVRHLEHHGIYYDCVVSLDAEKPEKYFEGLQEYPEKPLICSITANKNILQMHSGKKIWYTDELFLGSLYRRHGIELKKASAGGSVATASVWIAHRMGIRNVILVGQDLAYGEESTHADGEISETPIEEKELWVEGINGNQVRTRSDWLYFLNWFEEQAKTGEIHFIDATEGGAKIHGSEIMSLSAAIEKYCKSKVSFGEELQHMKPTFSEKAYKTVKCELFQMPKEVQLIKSIAKRGIQFCKEYISKERKLSENRKAALLEEIAKANDEINRKELVIELLDAYVFEKTQKALSDINTNTGDVEKERFRYIKAALAVYEAFAEGVDTLEKKLDEGLGKL